MTDSKICEIQIYDSLEGYRGKLINNYTQPDLRLCGQEKYPECYFGITCTIKLPLKAPDEPWSLVPVVLATTTGTEFSIKRLPV